MVEKNLQLYYILSTIIIKKRELNLIYTREGKIPFLPIKILRVYEPGSTVSIKCSLAPSLSYIIVKEGEGGGRIRISFDYQIVSILVSRSFFLPPIQAFIHPSLGGWRWIFVCVRGWSRDISFSKLPPITGPFIPSSFFDHNLTIGRNLSRPPTTPSCEFYRERKFLHRARDTSSCAQFINRGRRRERERMKIVRVVYYIIRFFYFYLSIC